MPNRRWSWFAVAALMIVSLLLTSCEVLLDPSLYEITPEAGGGGAVGGGGSSDFPIIDPKPEPVTRKWKGCPAVGDGGDPGNNTLKNRVDEGNYVAVSFDALAGLPWPSAIERRDRKNWSEEDTAAIAQYEGTPVVIEGYLWGGKESGPESPNCHGTENEFVDWHIWLTANAGEEREVSIVIETTPRVRAHHPNWSLKLIKKIADNQLPVRISGWVFFDPEHPEQIGKTRITIWEIHPVMEMDIYVNGEWISMDDWNGEF